MGAMDKNLGKEKMVAEKKEGEKGKSKFRTREEKDAENEKRIKERILELKEKAMKYHTRTAELKNKIAELKKGSKDDQMNKSLLEATEVEYKSKEGGRQLAFREMNDFISNRTEEEAQKLRKWTNELPDIKNLHE